jgi:cytochrome oxidase assembly protein ShyY1
MQRVRMTRASSKRSNWFSWAALVLLFTVACWFLAQWQFDRQEEVVAKNALISKNYEAEPVELSELLSPDQAWDSSLEYRSTSLTGSYIPEASFLVRNRPLNAYPGFLQLVAFKSDSGSVIWVERGWLPTGSATDLPDEIPQVDEQVRTIEIRLRKAEPNLDRTAPQGQISSIHLDEISSTFGESVYTQAYGRLVAESPELPIGQKIPKPVLSEGNHLSYAMQWILFGLMAIGAVLWTLSQERRRNAGLPPRRLRILNRDKDAEIEDELLG